MSRPTREESIYQVSIHRNGGYMYASTHPYTTDEKTGKCKYVNLHWGTVEEGNRFVPGRRYIFASPEERAKLVFPKDWDLSEANKQFSSTLEVLDEMRSIRCIEHTNRAKFITPFVGGQLDICEAFDFKTPEGCTPKYASRKKSAPHRGRPSMPKTTTLES